LAEIFFDYILKLRAAITAQFGFILREGIHPTVEIGMKDFFISYNKADKQWAVWIAWQLEEAGYSLVIQEWDFRPGGNFVIEMQRALADTKKMIAVLSESYLNAEFTQPEWAAVFAKDPQSLDRNLLLAKVGKCTPTGLLAPLIYVSLLDVDGPTARERLLDALKDRGKPDRPPFFPGGVPTEPVMPELREIKVEPFFPNAVSELKKLKRSGLQSQYNALSQRYQKLIDQINGTSNSDDKDAQRYRLNSIYEEMTEVAISLDELNS
jgi:TIR domain/Effector-associated domain 9